jgi:hypothetical protein
MLSLRCYFALLLCAVLMVPILICHARSFLRRAPLSPLSLDIFRLLLRLSRRCFTDTPPAVFT